MNDETSFEEALAALEAKVEELSRGDLSLDHALAAFEQGLALYRRARELLARAEQRVARLVETEEGLAEGPFLIG